MSRAELILYATPVGPLADALDRLQQHLGVTGPTTAQEYPPHCTLTGFLLRSTADLPRIRAELNEALADLAPPAVDAVRVVELHRRPDWIGLELESPWLKALTTRFIELHHLGPEDDPLRPKDWLHLSIAYGTDDLGPARDAVADFDPEQSAEWHVALWRRHRDGTWTKETHDG